MSVYRLSVTMLPAVVKGRHTASTTVRVASVADGADERATDNGTSQPVFHRFFFRQNVSNNQG